MTVKRAVLKGLPLPQFTQVFVRIDYRGSVYRTQNMTNKDRPNEPEWETTITFDVFELTESLQISVFYSQSENFHLFGSCKIRLSTWCRPEPYFQAAELEKGAGVVHMKAVFERFAVESDDEDTLVKPNNA
jgi:hypothetical protein